MDVEKTMEFLLEQQARFEARMVTLDAKLDRVADLQDRMAERQTVADRQMEAIRSELRRGIRLSVEEHRRERQRRRQLREEMTALHQVTEQKLQSLIESLKQPRNGH